MVFLEGGFFFFFFGPVQPQPGMMIDVIVAISCGFHIEDQFTPNQIFSLCFLIGNLLLIGQSDQFEANHYYLFIYLFVCFVFYSVVVMGLKRHKQVRL